MRVKQKIVNSELKRVDFILLNGKSYFKPLPRNRLTLNKALRRLKQRFKYILNLIA